MTASEGCVHRALIYDERDELLSSVTSFLREGVDAGERGLVWAAPQKIEWIRGELGEQAEAVDFESADVVYRIQGRATRALIGYLAKARGDRVRLVAEQSLALRTSPEVLDYLRMESAANVVFGSSGLSILCPYDAATLSEEVLETCRGAHPGLVRNGADIESASYRPPAEFIRGLQQVTYPPLSAVSFGCDGPEDLAPARSFMRAQAAALLLDREATADLVLAVDEVLSNAILHGHAPGRVWVYREGLMLVCHVHDSGPGFADPLAGYLPPDQDAARGRGLWIARQICDCVEVANDATGTHVRLLVKLPAAR